MPTSSLVGRVLGNYRVVALIGAGGMGEVYRAHDERLDRDVALKTLPAAFCDDEGKLRRFEQEARALAALNDPNLLAIFDGAPVAFRRTRDYHFHNSFGVLGFFSTVRLRRMYGNRNLPDSD